MSKKKTREEMVDLLVKWDIDTVRSDLFSDDISFLDAVLRGDGWIPYNQLTDEQVLVEYEERCEDYLDEMGVSSSEEDK
jgi:hypothetical protein